MPKQYLEEPVELLNRTRESYSFNHKLTFDAGKCIPFFCQPVIAGETWQLSASALCRTLSLVTCPLDNAKISVWFFWAPCRILYDKYRNFRGELEDYWTGTEQTYTLPQMTFPSGGFSENSVADYFGVPTKVAPSNVTLSHMRYRAYSMIWNEWFRDQYLMPKILYQKDGTTVTGSQTGGDFINTAARGGDVAPLCRPHDLFGSALPFAQRGNPEPIPIKGSVPVIAVDTSLYGKNYGTVASQYHALGSGSYPGSTGTVGFTVGGGSGTTTAAMALYTGAPSGVSFSGLTPENLRAFFGNSQSALTSDINDLRVSIAVQHLKEREAISGSRYREILRSMYGVEYPDPLMDIPTYLGGYSQYVEFSPVVQTSSTDSVSPQGNVSGYSATGIIDNGFLHEAIEDGLIIGILGVRNVKTYQNGIDRAATMKDELDIWNPMFNGLGQMAILNQEIFLDDSSGNKNTEVFGYQDAWYWWHSRPNIVSGQFRANATNSLAAWHFADNYTTLPVLGRTWMSDNSATNINRVLAAQAPTYPQFLCDITVEGTVTSAMPAHMSPGIHRV